MQSTWQFEYLSYRVDWIKSYQGMVALAGNQIWWTWEVEDVFHKAKKGGKTAMKVSLKYTALYYWLWVNVSNIVLLHLRI